MINISTISKQIKKKIQKKLKKKIIEILEKGELPKVEEEKSKPLSSIEDLTKNKDNKGGAIQGQRPQLNPNFMQNVTDILKKLQ